MLKNILFVSLITKYIYTQSCRLNYLPCEDLIKDQNGSLIKVLEKDKLNDKNELTITGLFKINKYETPLSLIKLDMISNYEDSGYETLFKIYYYQTKDYPLLTIEYASEQYQVKQINQIIPLQQNDWIYWTLSFSYKLGEGSFRIHPNAFNQEIKFKLNDQSFVFLDQLTLSYNCFYINQALSGQCQDIDFGNTIYVNNYFENTYNFFMLNLINTSETSQNISLNKKHEEIKIQANYLKGEQQYNEDGFMIFKGKNYVETFQEFYVNFGYTLNYQFQYKEPLLDNFNLVTIYTEDGFEHFRLVLSKKQNGKRSIQFYSGGNYKFETIEYLQENKRYSIEIAFINDRFDDWVIINDNENKIRKQGLILNIPLLEYRLEHLLNDQYIDGEFTLFSFMHIQNVDGIIFPYDKLQQCGFKCKSYLSLRKFFCSACPNNQVKDEFYCYQNCPEQKYSYYGYCKLNDPKSFYSQNLSYFDAVQTKPNEIQVYQTNQVFNLKPMFNENFKIYVLKNGMLVEDYKVIISEIPNSKSASFELQFGESLKNVNKQVILELINDELNDQQGNLLKKQKWIFEFQQDINKQES